MDESFVADLPDQFFFELRLLESEGKAKVLAKPTITVLNGNVATVDVGQTQYFKIVGGTADAPTYRFQPIKHGITTRIRRFRVRFTRCK